MVSSSERVLVLSLEGVQGLRNIVESGGDGVIVIIACDRRIIVTGSCDG